MALERSDYTDQAPAPFGKREVRYPSPAIADLVVVETVPISPEKYKPLPYGSPHPDYSNNGLVLTWQGPVKAANNQVKAVRVYASRSLVEGEAQDWFNYFLHYSGDVSSCPIFIRSYLMFRADYAPLTRGQPFKGIYKLVVTNGGDDYTAGTPPTVVFTGGAGSGAAASAIMDETGAKVIGFELTSEGDGYTSAPTISFTGGSGSGATATAYIQPATALLVKEETAKLDSEDPQLASLFIKVTRVYETLPGALLIWNSYEDEKAGGRRNRGAVKKTSQSILAVGNEVSTFTRPTTGKARRIWFEPRGESAIVLTKFIEDWTEIAIDEQRVTSEFGGGILDVTETRDEPGAQTVDTGFLVTNSELKTISPDEQIKITEKLSPSSAIPVLELTNGGGGYTTPPTVSFSGGTGSAAAASAVLGFSVTSISVTGGGSGYSAPPAVGFLGGGGGGCFALATLSYTVSSIGVTAGGSGYATPPTVAVTGDGTGATASAVLGFGVATAAVTAVGSGFTGIPAVIFTGDGTGAQANAVMGHPVLSASVSAPGSGYTSAPTVAFSGGGGAGAAATAILGYTLATITPSAGGSGYTDPPTVVIAPPANGGVQATAHTELTADAVTSVVIDDPGSGYESAPAISFSGGGGTGAVAAAALSSTGVIKRLAITNGGTAGYTSVPTIAFSGGAGTGGAATAVLDPVNMLISRIDIVSPGSGYTSAPTMSFSGGGGTGLTATAALASTGSVKSVTITAAGSGYTAATIGFSSGSGTGAAATAVLASTGSVKSIAVNTPGSFKTVPTISLIGDGTGAAATAVLASTGSVIEVNLTTEGNYSVAPSVVFSGSGGTLAAAIYHIGDALWPALTGFDTDPTYGIVIDHIKKVVPAGTLYPGRITVFPFEGPFVDLSTHDRWKSIQIASKVDLSTLPLPETYPIWHSLSLPPTLLSIEAIWSDVESKLTEALAKSAHVSVSSGSGGGIIVTRSSGYRGYLKGTATRLWFYGPPPDGSIPTPLKIIPSSGSVVLVQTHSNTHYSEADDGGISFGDSFQNQIHATDVNDHLVKNGSFPILNPEHYSPPQSAVAESGGGSIAAVSAFGTRAFMTVRIPDSSPSSLVSGQTILVDAIPERWRFAVWTLELIYLKVP